MLRSRGFKKALTKHSIFDVAAVLDPHLGIIIVRWRDFVKPLLLPFTRCYNCQILTLGYVRDTSRSYTNFRGASDAIITRSRDFQKMYSFSILTRTVQHLHKTCTAGRFRSTESIHINPWTTSFPHRIGTSQLIWRANQLTGFYMMGNIGH